MYNTWRTTVPCHNRDVVAWINGISFVLSVIIPLKFSAPQQHKKKQVEAQMFMYRRVHRTGYDFFLQLLAATCSCSKHVRLKQNRHQECNDDALQLMAHSLVSSKC